MQQQAKQAHNLRTMDEKRFAGRIYTWNCTTINLAFFSAFPVNWKVFISNSTKCVNTFMRSIIGNLRSRPSLTDQVKDQIISAKEKLLSTTRYHFTLDEQRDELFCSFFFFQSVSRQDCRNSNYPQREARKRARRNRTRVRSWTSSSLTPRLIAAVLSYHRILS